MGLRALRSDRHGGRRPFRPGAHLAAPGPAGGGPCGRGARGRACRHVSRADGGADARRLQPADRRGRRGVGGPEPSTVARPVPSRRPRRRVAARHRARPGGSHVHHRPLRTHGAVAPATRLVHLGVGRRLACRRVTTHRTWPSRATTRPVQTKVTRGGRAPCGRRQEDAMSEPGSNLARVVAIWGEMAPSQTMAPLADAMAEDVVWQGLLPELICRGRAEVCGVLGSAPGGRLPSVTRMEAEEWGDRVVLTVEGPDFGPGPAGSALEPAGGPRTLALSFHDGRVVHIESFATREEALGVGRELLNSVGCLGSRAGTRPGSPTTSTGRSTSSSRLPATSAWTPTTIPSGCSSTRTTARSAFHLSPLTTGCPVTPSSPNA